MTGIDLGSDVPVARSRSTRTALVLAGHASVGLGVIGAFLPILPTTVFLIVAASCYAKGSPRLHGWLVGHPVFGPVIRDWREHRAMSVPAKVWAIGTILVTFLLTIFVAMRSPVPRILYALLGTLLIGIILRIRTRR